MLKPVIVSKKSDLKLGKIYRGLVTGPWCEPEPFQCFRVVARSTSRGWVNYLVSVNGEKDREWLEMLTFINGPWYYYEIQTD